MTTKNTIATGQPGDASRCVTGSPDRCSLRSGVQSDGTESASCETDWLNSIPVTSSSLCVLGRPARTRTSHNNLRCCLSLWDRLSAVSVMLFLAPKTHTSVLPVSGFFLRISFIAVFICFMLHWNTMEKRQTHKRFGRRSVWLYLWVCVRRSENVNKYVLIHLTVCALLGCMSKGW